MSSATFILFLLLLLIFHQSSSITLLLLILTANPSHNRPGQQLKYFINIAIILRTSFKKLYPVSFSQSQTLLMRNLSIMLKVTLSSNQNHVYLCLSCLLDLIHPRLNVIETHRISNGVGKDDPMRTLIERFGDIPESLLTGSVPNVESDLSAIELDSLDLEINPNCTQIL